MDLEQIKFRLKNEGFTDIHEYDDPANEFFADHDHPGDELLVVVRGSIEIIMDSAKTILNPGDELFFPAKKIHSAKIGSSGCFYVVGEKPVV
jgi:quercetin dioxygenase-like cupin family protein